MYGNNGSFEQLVGHVIKSVEIHNDGQHVMRVLTEDAYPFYFVTAGDCCSESWFSDIYNLSALRGKVLSVEQKETRNATEEEAKRTRQEYDLIYGYTIQTENGTVDVVFRNSSNGYYGGDCERFSEDEVVSWGYKLDEFTKLEGDDWSA